MGCASRKDKNAHSESEDDGTEDGPVKSTNKTTANGDANRKGIVFEEAHAKLVIIGDTKCGKSSLVHRTLNDSFPTEISAESQITIAVDQNIIGTRKTITDHVTWNKMSRALVCEYNVGDQVLQRDNAVVRAFRGVFLVFAVDSRESFEKMKNFKLSLIQHYTFYVELVKYVIGLKVDVSNRAVSRDDAISFVETKNQEDIKEFGEDFVNWQYLELSAKDGTGIDDWKKELIKIISEF